MDHGTTGISFTILSSKDNTIIDTFKISREDTKKGKVKALDEISKRINLKDIKLMAITYAMGDGFNKIQTIDKIKNRVQMRNKSILAHGLNPLNENDAQKVSYNDANAEILIEEYIAGREFTVMCLEGKAYCVTELKAKNEFYDYEAKYTDGMTQHVLPADIDEKTARTCKKYAEVMHKVLNCNTLSRCDFRYNPQDGVVFLEINTNPGMTKLSLVPEQAKYIGISYADLCDKLVKNAACRKR